MWSPRGAAFAALLLLLRNLVVLLHLAQHKVAAFERTLGIAHRRVILWSLGKSRQQSRLRQRQVTYAFVEVVL